MGVINNYNFYDTHTYIRTWRLNDQPGPEGRVGENHMVFVKWPFQRQTENYTMRNIVIDIILYWLKHFGFSLRVVIILNIQASSILINNSQLQGANSVATGLSTGKKTNSNFKTHPNVSSFGALYLPCPS